MKKLILLVFLFIGCTEHDLIINEFNINNQIQLDSLKPFIVALDTVSQSVGKVKLFLLTGQSNATGAALNSAATTLELSEHNNFKIFQENNAFANLSISGNNNYSQNSVTHGLELGLSEILSNEVVYMAKLGLGSTSITSHLPNYIGDVYARWKNNFVDPAISYLESQNIDYEIIVVYWQGEEDAKTEVASLLYSDRFDELITLYKSNWGANVKIRIMEINAAATPYSTTINDVFSVKALTESNLEVIPMKSKGTQIHFQYTHMKEGAQLLVDSL